MGGKSYPLPIRVLSFEGQYQAQDPKYKKPGVKTTAEELRRRFASALASARGALQLDMTPSDEASVPALHEAEAVEPDEEQDALRSYEEAAINAFMVDKVFLAELRERGKPWRGVQEHLKAALPEVLSDRDNIAYHLVAKAMNAVFGEQDTVWKTEKRPRRGGSGYTTWIVVLGTTGDA